MIANLRSRVARNWRIALAGGLAFVVFCALCARWLHSRSHLVQDVTSAPALTVAALAGAVLLVGAAREDARRRRHWREVVAYPPVQMADALQTERTDTRQAGLARRRGIEVAPYIRRGVHDDLALALERERWVVVRGQRGAGVSRTVLEALRTASPPLAFLLRPGPITSPASRRPSPDLFAVDLPIRANRANTVLWIATSDDRVVQDEELAVKAIERFLVRHPALTLIIELELASDVPGTVADTARDRRDAIARAAPRSFLINRELAGQELIDAACLYPSLSEDKRRFLPEYLTTYDDHIHRLTFGPNPTGAAIVNAALDWKHCGCAGGAPISYLRVACQYYLPTSQELVRDHDFERGLRWAAEPFLGAHALLYPALGERGCEPAHVLVDRGWRADVAVPIEVWELIRSVSTDRPGDLIAVGDAARKAGEFEIARNLWSHVEEWAGDLDAKTASGRRRALSDEEVSDTEHSVIPRLLERSANRGVREALTLLSPPAVRLVGEPDDGLFDPRLPVSDRNRVNGYYAKLYRYRTLRFMLRTCLLLALDVLATVGGMTLGVIVKALVTGADTHGPAPEVWFALAVTVPAIAVAGGYRHDARCARLDRLTLALSASAALSAVVGAAHGESAVASTTVWASFAIVLPLCFLLRAVYDAISRWWVRHHGLSTRALIVGPSAPVRTIAHRMRHSRGRPTTLVGYVSTDDESDPARLGSLDELEKVLEQYRIHYVVVADRELTLQRVLLLFERCQLYDVRVDKALSVDETRVFDKRIPIGETIALQPLRPLALDPFSDALKRAFDVVVGTACLVVAAPVMAVLALILLKVRRGVLVRSYVPGRGHETFGLLKFRTTAIKHDRARGAVASSMGVNIRADRFGALLRRYALDELPQLVNVVRGDMSLVGPRPLGVEHYDRMEAWHRLRYLVRPGLTGGWQISRGRRWSGYDDMVLHDLVYLRGWSLWRDCEIVLMTPIAVIRQARRRRSAGDGDEEHEPPGI